MNRTRRVRLRRILSNLVVALPLVAGVGLVAYQRVAGVAPPAELGIKPGDLAPEVQLEDARGEAVSLATLLDGRPTLLMVVHPICGPCDRELEALAEVRARPGGALPFRLLVLSLGTAPETGALRGRVADFPVYRDFAGVLYSRDRVRTPPVLLFVDAEGNVRQVRTGAQGARALRAALSDDWWSL
ncbi:MAG TPA: redoxin domain-containing protein [Longimicrobium sp.]|nr:redoxin domain-containing protein [Longimicrobium sp.]